MNPDSAITLKEVTLHLPVRKGYRNSLGHALARMAGEQQVGGYFETDQPGPVSVTALKDVNLSINRGDRVGLIGHNGAGKSSLLRLMAGIYRPSKGTVHIRGRVSTLFTNVLGIQRDATGRENITISGLTLGLSRKEIEALLPEIAEFSELGPFLDMPVRTYSSGMQMRLGFSVATSIHPEILLIDEVFGAGDSQFRQKAKARVSRLLESAATLIFASHADSTLKEFCSQLVWLDHGEVRAFGATDEVLRDYRGRRAGKSARKAKARKIAKADQPAEREKRYDRLFRTSLRMIRTREFQTLERYFPRLAKGLSGLQAQDSDRQQKEASKSLDFRWGSLPPFPVAPPMDWTVDPFGDRTWKLFLHGLDWLIPHLRGNGAGREENRLAALALIRDWLESHGQWVRPNRNRFEYSHQAVVMRLQAFMSAFNAVQDDPNGDPVLRLEILTAILGHAALLASARNYRPKHNIGLRADLAILQVCDAFPELANRKDLIDWAVTRLIGQCKSMFTPDGVHMEHSPHFADLVHKRLVDAIQICDRLGVGPGRLDVLRNVAEKGADFATHMRTSHGIPAIGDSMGAFSFDDKGYPESYLRTQPELTFAISRKNGRLPSRAVRLYPDSGWSFFRNGWHKDPRHETYMAVQSDYYSADHYQEDDTSFILQSAGQDFIIDPGLSSYNFDKFREFSQSCYAHNLLVVDGKRFNVQAAHQGKSGITRYRHESNGGSGPAAVEFTHPHYAALQVSVYRQVAWMQGISVGLREIVEAQGEHDYDLLFHLDAGAKVERVSETGFRCSWRDRSLALLLRTEHDSFEVVEGQKSPMQGWIFADGRPARPAPVLILKRRHSGNLDWRTLITFDLDGSEPDFDSIESFANDQYARLDALDRRIPGTAVDTSQRVP